MRLLRPWPASQLASVLGDMRAVGVIDQNLSPGLGGILFPEVAAALFERDRHPCLRSFISGLGGKDIEDGELDHVLETLECAHPGQGPVTPELLLTEEQWNRVEGQMALAGAGEGAPQ